MRIMDETAVGQSHWTSRRSKQVDGPARGPDQKFAGLARLKEDAGRFLEAADRTIATARQRAAFALVFGEDLDAALRSGPGELRRMLARLHRLLERERLKGGRRHWSYDLNRHIALKQAADRMAERLEALCKTAGRDRANL